MSEVMDQGSRFLRDLGDAANRNPLSAALIGMGVLWMFAGRSGARKVRALLGRGSDTAGQTLDRASDIAGRRFGQASDFARRSLDSAGSAVSSGASAARRTMNESAETMQRRATEAFGTASQSGREQMRALSEVSQYGSSMPQRGGGRLQDFGNSLTDLFREQPFAVGAIGAAIGAGIAAALPLTDKEAEYLGQAGEAVKERASRAMDAAQEEARKQGRTTEGAKSVADEMSSKVGRVADAAKEGVADGAKATQ